VLDQTFPEARETVMTIEEMLINQGIAKGLASGRVEGRVEGAVEAGAKAVLRVLAKRGVPVPEVVRGRIVSCTDPSELERMLDRALEVTIADELFAH
jgi:hypothetical protein